MIAQQDAPFEDGHRPGHEGDMTTDEAAEKEIGVEADGWDWRTDPSNPWNWPAAWKWSQVAMLARRINGKYLAPKSQHLADRVREIENGDFQSLLEALMAEVEGHDQRNGQQRSSTAGNQVNTEFDDDEAAMQEMEGLW